MKKILCTVLTMVMLLSICGVAFADGGFYYGSMSSGFNASQTFNKINDKTIEDDNQSSRVGSYTSNTTTDYLSILRVAGSTVSSSIVGDGGYHTWTGDKKGTFSLRVENQAAGTTYIRGRMYIYNGSTTRTITDWSNYWG
ncbi:MAG: hypothetical protein PUC76_04305 [Clostridia bacterium]|nr:hypothetical protein [Clostridia bacterium]